MPDRRYAIIPLLFWGFFFCSFHHSSAQRIFWTERNNDRIQVANLTPTGITGTTPYVSGLNSPVDLSLDPAKNYLFLTEQGGESLIRRNYNGTSPLTIRDFGAFTGFEDIAYSSNAGGVFGALYTDEHGANYVPEDGSPELDLPLPGQNNDDYISVAVDDGNEFVYLVNYDDNGIYLTDFGGSSVNMIISFGMGEQIQQITVDYLTAKIYFTTYDGSPNFRYNIYSCNSDGSGLTQLVSLNNVEISSIQSYSQFGKVYYAQGETIYGMNDDGSAITPLLTLPGGTGLADIAIEADFDPPIITALTPLDNATNVDASTTSSIVVTFSELVKIPTGSVLPGSDLIQIFEEGTLFTTVNRNSPNIGIVNNVATITLPISLNQAKDYHVLIGVHVFEDMSGNDFSGIASTTAWNFTTICTSLTAGTATGDQSLCINADPAIIAGGTASGGDGTFTYQWESSITSSTGGFTPIPTAINADYDPPAGITVTTYYRRIVNSATCTPAPGNPITITVVPIPILATTASDQQACDGLSVTFDVSATGTPPITYQWQADNGSGFADISDGALYGGTTTGTLTVFDVTGLNNYRYQCVVTSAGVCSVTSSPALLTTNSAPVANDQTPPPLCETTAGTLQAVTDLTTLNAAVTGGAANRSVTWYEDNDYTTPVPNPSGATVTNGQIFYVQVINTLTDCEARAQATFTVNAQPVATANPTTATICSGTATNIALSGATSYSWTVSSNPNITGASAGSGATINQTLTNTSATQQLVTFTVTPSNGCTGQPINVPVTVDPQPTVFNVSGGGIYCSGGAGVAITLSNSQPGVTYELYNNNSPTGITAAQGGGQLTFPLVTAAGTYTVRGSTANLCAANMNGNAIVTVSNLPSNPGTISGPNQVCAGQSVTYTVPNNPNVQYVWTLPAGFEATSGINTNSVTVSIAGGSGGTVSVLTRNTCGDSNPSQLGVLILPPPDVEIVLPAEAFAEEEVVFSFNSSSSISTVLWNFGNGTTSTDVAPSPQLYTEGGDYTISVMVTDAQGCSGNDTKVLTVNPKADLSDFSIKNVVTANGDTKNAFLYIERIEKFPDNEVVLLDRWGVEVFRRKGYNNDWDLRKNDDFLPAGNYVCIVKVIETGKVYKRTVTVIRGR